MSINKSIEAINTEQLKESVVLDKLDDMQKLNLIETTTQYNAEKEKLEKMMQGDVFLAPNKQSGRTNPVLFNDDLQRAELDLRLSFKKIDTAFSSLEANRELNNSIVSNLTTNVATLSDEVYKLKDTAMALGEDIVYVDNFRNTDSVETNQVLYTDENGKQVDISFKAEYDNMIEAMKIPKLVSLNKLVASNGQRMGIIEIKKQLGSGLINIKNPINTVDKSIDTDLTSYWSETILTDEPINVKLDDIKYYGHNFGALCELEISFNSITDINEITLSTFGSFPMNIIAIRYYQTDRPDLEEDKIIARDGNLSAIEIVSPNAEDYLKGGAIKDDIAYQFPAIAAKRLRIILNQMHYVKNSFTYNKNEADKNMLWFGTKQATTNMKVHQQGMYDLKAFVESQFVLFSNKIKGIKSIFKIDLERFIMPKDNKLSKMTKYEYSYGLYNIAVNENNYRNLGVYISKPIKMSKNIAAVALEAEEFKLDDHSIEYFVALTDIPDSNDWIPIRNGHQINLAKMLNDGQLECSIHNEKHFGARGKTISLEHTPYINLTKPHLSYISLSIIQPNGEIIAEGPMLKNITNYNIPKDSYKRFTDGNAIEYYFYDDKIYLNKSLSKDYIIEIEYKHFIDSIRFKAVLRRSTLSNTGLSPILNGYKLTFKAVK